MNETRRRGTLASILTEPSPCSPCVHAKRCAKGLLACQEFQIYLGTNGSSAWPGTQVPDSKRIPTRALYAKVHAHYPTKAETAWRVAGQERTKRRVGS